MRYLKSISLLAVLLLAACCAGCEQETLSSSGIKQATVQVKTQSNGLTMEQSNIAQRLQEDNLPGSLKHLYVISAFSGDVILYSTVRGKVTSSGKRLKPYSIAGDRDYNEWFRAGPETFAGGNQVNLAPTKEVVQDDGTFGSSVEYIYWWDSKGVYHQH